MLRITLSFLSYATVFLKLYLSLELKGLVLPSLYGVNRFLIL
nr:MAG TPA: hypothetical protein [Caudoviricetes sp.]